MKVTSRILSLSAASLLALVLASCATGLSPETQEIAGLGPRVAELQSQLAGRDALIASLKQQINEAEQTVMVDLRNQVAGRDGRIADLEQQLAQLDGDLRDQKLQDAALQSQLDHYRPFEPAAAELQRQILVKDAAIAELTKGSRQLQAIVDQDKRLLAQSADQARQLQANEALIADQKARLAEAARANADSAARNAAYADRLQQMAADADLAAGRLNDISALNASLGGQLEARTRAAESANERIRELMRQNEELSGGASVERSQLQGAIDSLTRERGGLRDQVAGLENLLGIATQKQARELQARLADLNRAFGDEIARGNIDIKQFRDVLVISVKDSVLFPPDSPVLLDRNSGVLTRLAEVFRRAPDRIVRVEGSTAVAVSSPETLRLYPTSWHLGAARAANVVRYLQEKCGMDPHQLVATSLGEYSPKADNLTEAGKALNRRVDFVLMARAFWELDRLGSVSAGGN